MTFSNIDIRDANSVTQQVGTFDDGSQQHATAVPLNAEISETTGINLSTTRVDTAINAFATWGILDLSLAEPSNTNTRVEVSGQFVTGGDYHSIRFELGGPHQRMPTRRLQGYVPSGTPVSVFHIFGTDGNNLDGGRLVLIPLIGVKSLGLRVTTGTFTGAVLRQMAGPMPPVLGPTTTVRASYNGDGTVAAATYDVGDIILESFMEAGRMSTLTAEAMPVLKQVSVADYSGTLADFDVVIGEPNYNSGQVQGSPLDFGYPEALRAWFECRSTPSTGQHQVRNFGSGNGTGVIIPNISIPVSDYSWNNAGSPGLKRDFDVFIVAAASTVYSGSAQIYIEGVVEE